MKAQVSAEASETIFRGALAPGAWDQLSPGERNQLRTRWARQLRTYTPAALRFFAASPNPCLVADATLQLKLVDPDQRFDDSPEELAGFIQFCNVHRQLVCHGVDPKGFHLLTHLESLRRHEVVLGISGMGKSTYMARIFCQAALQHGPMVLIDQEKILLEEVLTHLPPERLKDVVIIDPSNEECSWGTNLVQFERGALDETDPKYHSKVHYLHERLASEITGALATLQLDTAGYLPGPYVRDALNNLFLAAVESESATMVDVYSLLTVPAIRDLVAPNVARESVRNWLQYDLTKYDQAKIDAARNKLHPFLRRVMINTFSRRETCTSIAQLLDQDKIIVLDLDSTRLSKPISRLIGYMFLILLRLTLEHRYSKAVEAGRLTSLKQLFLMVDEFRNFASASTIDLFAEGRKRNVSFVAGLQSLDQVEEAVANSLYNVSTWTVFNSGPDDAAKVCKLFGFTNRLGMPQLEEVTALPKHVAKLRYEAEHRTDGLSPYGFQYVTLHTYPAMPANPHARQLVQELRERSRRAYYKPNTEEDTRTMYDANDRTNDAVLRALWDAHIAIRHPDTYHLAGKEHLAREGAKGTYVAQTLIHAVLESRGNPITKGRLAQSIRYLKARNLAVTEALPSGFKTTRLTPEGVRALERQITPGTSSNEGGPAHRKAVLAAFIAFSQTGALRLSVPIQATDKYVPDLVLEDPPAPLRTLLGLPEGVRLVHIQVEVATAQHPDRMATNILNALKADAYPLLILPGPEHAGRVAGALERLGNHGNRLTLEEAGRTHKRAWAALTIGSKQTLQPLEVADGDKSRAAPRKPSALHAAIGAYLDIADGPIRLSALLRHLASKGLHAPASDVTAALKESGLQRGPGDEWT